MRVREQEDGAGGAGLRTRSRGAHRRRGGGTDDGRVDRVNVSHFPKPETNILTHPLPAALKGD